MAVAHDLFPPSPDPDDSDARGEDLARLLAVVERAAQSRGWGRPAQLVRFEPAAGGFAVAVHPLPAGAHPEVALLGLDAPDGWPTLGVIAEGSAVAVGDGDDDGDGDGSPTPSTTPTTPDRGLPTRPATRAGDPGRTTRRGTHGAGAHPRPPRPSARRRGRSAGRRVRVALVAARSGLVASLVRVEGDEPSAAVHRAPGRRPEGRLVDLLLRALALPTAPPPAGTTRLWAVLWLQRALALAEVAPGPGWEAVAALHPAHQIATGGPPPPLGTVPAGCGAAPRGMSSFVEVAAAAGALVPWEGLRADAAAGRWPAPRLRPADAAWMDAGAFARWVEAELPPLDALVRRAAHVLPDPVASRVRDAVASWRLGGR